MLTVIVAGRNDDYGKDFRERLFRTALHNSTLLSSAGIDFEYLLAEWNPLPDRPALCEEFVARVPNARGVIIPPEVHQKYTLNPQMPFHEMAAKNAALRRACGDVVIVTNADILFSEAIVERVAAGNFAADTLYRAHRIDVNPQLGWDEMQNPANQLPSGEGFLPPPYYLGAGGDFCLAVTPLWHSLTGFNEQIRFSTRAKDWQFFLNAAAQDAAIEFIGDVYHLDHEGGFRNTNSADLNAVGVHFGRWWDIEFGLPVTNSADWGFHGVREHPYQNDPRIVSLESRDYNVSAEQDHADRELMAWVTRPPDTHDTAAAVLFHAVCGAHQQDRRLVCRIRDPRLAATLAGFDVVASRYGVALHCNWKWPSMPGYTLRPFSPEPLNLRRGDWIFEESDAGGVQLEVRLRSPEGAAELAWNLAPLRGLQSADTFTPGSRPGLQSAAPSGLRSRTSNYTHAGVRLYEYGTAREVDILPKVMRINEPEFNPALARRLLWACLGLQTESANRIAICGNGTHTRELLRWGLPDSIELAAIIDSNDLDAIKRMNVDAVLLSSASFETDMSEACTRHGIPNIIALYNDWPRNMWALTAEVAAGGAV